MIRIEYSQTHYEDLLKMYANVFGSKVKDNAVVLPHEFGDGSIRLLVLSNGVQVYISDYVPLQDILLNRKKSTKELYLLRFEEMVQYNAGVPVSKSGIFLTTTAHDDLFLYTAGTHVKTISAFFSKDWLSDFLSHDEKGAILNNYLSSNPSSYNYELTDAEYKKLMQELLHVKAGPSLEQMVIHNRIMLLLERFFSRLYFKITDAHFNVKISSEDIARIKLTEAALVKDFSEPPPKIAQLTKVAAMSLSKLKKTFKEMFGTSLYQYFQKQRMNKAKAMLLSRKYSLRQVSEDVGFASPLKFTQAFQKTFDQLPDDIIKN